jgi:hypothetical protein
MAAVATVIMVIMMEGLHTTTDQQQEMQQRSPLAVDRALDTLLNKMATQGRTITGLRQELTKVSQSHAAHLKAALTSETAALRVDSSMAAAEALDIDTLKDSVASHESMVTELREELAVISKQHAAHLKSAADSETADVKADSKEDPTEISKVHAAEEASLREEGVAATNSPSRPDCTEWQCTCQGMSEKYNMWEGKWGRALEDPKKKVILAWWRDKNCSTIPDQGSVAGEKLVSLCQSIPTRLQVSVSWSVGERTD